MNTESEEVVAKCLGGRRLVNQQKELELQKRISEQRMEALLGWVKAASVSDPIKGTTVYHHPTIGRLIAMAGALPLDFRNQIGESVVASLSALITETEAVIQKQADELQVIQLKIEENGGQ